MLLKLLSPSPSLASMMNPICTHHVKCLYNARCTVVITSWSGYPIHMIWNITADLVGVCSSLFSFEMQRCNLRVT